jgi:hypothetical protein
MKTVTIYLRSVEINKKNHLAMFDSNRNSDIDNLITVAPSGGRVIWKLDCLSGIRSITKIYSKTGKKNVFINDPVKLLLCKGFKLLLPIVKGEQEEEEYTIEYVLCDGNKMKIDPMIRIPPPPPSHG